MAKIGLNIGQVSFFLPKFVPSKSVSLINSFTTRVGQVDP